MTSFPNFKTHDHYEDFVGIFKERAENYINLMNIVKDHMYGPGAGNYANLPGTCQEVLYKVTQQILSDADDDFKMIYPEYKSNQRCHPESAIATNFSLGEK